jgi:hypothetical protein
MYIVTIDSKFHEKPRVMYISAPTGRVAGRIARDKHKLSALFADTMGKIRVKKMGGI